MQIGGDALGLEGSCLVGPAPRDQGERGPRPADLLHLLAAQLRWDEPEDANAPPPPLEPRRRLGQPRPDGARAARRRPLAPRPPRAAPGRPTPVRCGPARPTPTRDR